MIADERHGDTEPRSAIDYIPGYNRFSDRVEEDDEPEVNDRTGRAIQDGRGRVNNAFPNAIGRDQQAGVENEWARN